MTDLGENDKISLLPHRYCVTYTLNLIGTKDILDAVKISNDEFYKIILFNFARCHKLWNKIRQSTVVLNLIENKLCIKLKIVNLTRWNSTYHALSMICLLLKEKNR